MAGIGTGLAPLYGIARDALGQGHTGAITLFIGARHSAEFYLIDELLVLAQTYKNFKFEYVALTSEGNFFTEGDIYQVAQVGFSSLAGYRVFLCGAASFVGKMRKQCFLAGAAMKAISADSFLAFTT